MADEATAPVTILERAMQVERDGRGFYLWAAQNLQDEAARQAFRNLADDEEQGEDAADAKDPRRRCDADGGAAGQQAQHIAAGDDEQLDQRHVFQAQRVTDIGGQVDRRDQQEGAAQPAHRGDRRRRQHEQGEEQPRLGHGHRARPVAVPEES